MHNRIILDATKTFECRFATGIQRVVRELIRRTDLIAVETGIGVVPAVASDGRYYKLNAEGITRLLEIPTTGNGAVVAQSGLAQCAKNLLQSSMPLYALMQRRSMQRRMTALTRSLEVLEIGADDIVVSIDEFAGGSPSVKAIGRAKGRGATTIAIIYDLIPILHRDLVPGRIAYLFKHGFERLVPLVDGLIAISRSGADLIREQPVVRRTGTAVSSFYLGQDLHVADDHPVAATIPHAAWEGGPTFVMVGTVEPRKRHAAVLAAFSRLWEEGCTANLVMIGKIGWEVEAFIDQARRHPRYGHSLFLCHQVSDGELRAAMGRADAMIMASKAEGFGLPIVEALACGVPVLATDIPIFREIAGDAGCYFPVDDPAEFAEVVKRFIADQQPYRDAARAFRWIDWDGSAREFAAAVENILEQSHKVHDRT